MRQRNSATAETIKNQSPTNKADQARSAQVLLLAQAAIDRYMAERKSRVARIAQERLGFKESFEIQKRSAVSDLIRNPVNALWAVPYVFAKRGLEALEKLGWEPARTITPKVPQSVRTKYQIEVENLIARELFGIKNDGSPSDFEVQLKSDRELCAHLDESRLKELIRQGEAEIRNQIREHASRQSGFTDFVSSTAMVLIADVSFGDKSLDIFGLGRRIAGLWAKNDAENGFFLGKSLGHAFYNIAPPPPPTATQLLLSTTLAMLAFALLSTVISAMSHPIQKSLGFKKRQLDTLIDVTSDKLLLKLVKELKAQKGAHGQT